MGKLWSREMGRKQVDQTLTEGKWHFDDGVTDVFNDMLERSIPQYEVMRETCFNLACQYVKPKTDIVDLGCSRGEAIAGLVRKFGAYNRFIGIEVSKPMIEACCKRFEGYIKSNVVEIREHDLRTGYPPVLASVTLAVLTIQFTPIEYRLRILSDIYEHTISSGAFIFIEKVLGASASLDRLMVSQYYDMKRHNGYTDDQIERKRLSLEGVLVPVTAKWNEELLRMSGWKEIDCFWRWMNFAGWVAIK
jgi:tRNA (cmo5U34)-methyltransferase